MSITIPLWVGYVFAWLIIAILLLALMWVFAVVLARVLERRHIYNMARVWITCRRFRLNAEKYTYGILFQIVDILRREDRVMYSDLKRHVFHDSSFDLVAFIREQAAFSSKTFGPGRGTVPRTAAVIDHIRKELVEIEQNPHDLEEWIDVILLALDGAWRHGGTPKSICATLAAKLEKNQNRKWPDWRTAPMDKAICHEK